jgi:uncharacterized protein YbjT (DUF2867 family)
MCPKAVIWGEKGLTIYENMVMSVNLLTVTSDMVWYGTTMPKKKKILNIFSCSTMTNAALQSSSSCRKLLACVTLIFLVISTTKNSITIGCYGKVLVTGATGRTGSQLYHLLQEKLLLDTVTLGKDDDGEPLVRALVRDANKARQILHCQTCDETEGIYVGDVTNVTTLLPALRGVHTVAIAVGATPASSDKQQRAIEFTGVQNTVLALTQVRNLESFGLTNLRVVLCSSMGTTDAENDFGHILFYKLNAEAFLGTCGIPTTIVKPCGLIDEGKKDLPNRTYTVNHHDAPTPTGSHVVPRLAVAHVMAEACTQRPKHNLRFDLCSYPGRSSESSTTTDWGALLQDAQWPWERGTMLSKEATYPST